MTIRHGLSFCWPILIHPRCHNLSFVLPDHRRDVDLSTIRALVEECILTSPLLANTNRTVGAKIRNFLQSRLGLRCFHHG